MKKVLLFGTFDFLHIGHIHILETAKKHGDRLVVSVARDCVVEAIKGKKSIHNEQERKRIVESLSLVDEVVLGDERMSTYEVVERVQPDVIVLGYDQEELKQDIERFLKHTGKQIDLLVADAYGKDKRKSSMIKKALHI